MNNLHGSKIAGLNKFSVVSISAEHERVNKYSLKWLQKGSSHAIQSLCMYLELFDSWLRERKREHLFMKLDTNLSA